MCCLHRHRRFMCTATNTKLSIPLPLVCLLYVATPFHRLIYGFFGTSISSLLPSLLATRSTSSALDHPTTTLRTSPSPTLIHTKMDCEERTSGKIDVPGNIDFEFEERNCLEGAKGLPPSTVSRSRSLKEAIPVPARLSWLALRPRWLPVTCASSRHSLPLRV